VFLIIDYKAIWKIIRNTTILEIVIIEIEIEIIIKVYLICRNV